jgi:glucose/arabinose dehydrogenase
MRSLRLTAALIAVCVAGSPAARAADEVLPTKSGPVSVERLAALNEPWGMEFLPDGRLLVTEKPGNLRIYADGKLSEPIGGVPKVAYREQGGLLDVAIDPDFARNGLVYLAYAEAAEVQPPNARDVPDPRFGTYFDKEDSVLKGGAVARGRLDGAQLRDVKVIWRQVPKTIGRGHFGGRLVFAPDGKLFITSGDRMRFDPAQESGSNLGKVVRINPDGSIPTDNPFAGKSGTQADIWSLGHRNPLGAAVHPSTRRLWVHEMGPLGGDELNVPEAGKNYGWPVVSNGDNYNNSPIPDHATRPEFAAPLTYWFPVISPSGFIFYSGSRFPAWKGHAFVGGLSSETLLRLKIEGDRVTEQERLGLRRRIRDVAEAPDGSIWVLKDGKDGELLRLSPAPK